MQTIQAFFTEISEWHACCFFNSSTENEFFRNSRENEKAAGSSKGVSDEKQRLFQLIDKKSYPKASDFFFKKLPDNSSMSRAQPTRGEDLIAFYFLLQARFSRQRTPPQKVSAFTFRSKKSLALFFYQFIRPRCPVL